MEPEVIGSHCSTLTRAVTESLLSLDKLRELDLEGSNLDDEMVRSFANSRQLQRLLIGGTNVTSTGLQFICKMGQLRELDIWALR